jgi:hypothetical protein
MKKLWILFILLLGSSWNAFSQEQPDQSKAEIKFEKEMHHFGKIREGELATYEFKFTNIGEEPLLITRVNVSCGCTTPEWSKDPIAPGKTGYIRATYNSANRPGVFNRSITVTTNAKTPVKVLSIQGDVYTPKPNEPVNPVSNQNSPIQKDNN